MSIDPAIALTSVQEFLSYMGIDYPERSALWVYYDGASLTATVEVEDTKIVLTDTVHVSTDVTFAANLTLTDVVDKINTILGWHSGLIYIGTLASTDLIITGSLDALGVDNEQTLNINDTHLIEQLINRASDFLNRICGRTLKTTKYTHERYDGGESKVFLEKWPVSAVAQVCSGKLDVVRIKYTSSTARNAYVKVSTTGVDLIVDGEGLDDELEFDDYETLALLIAAIDGETNWEATVVNTDYSDYPSDQLFRKLNRFALNQDICLEMPDEPLDGYEIDYDNGILYFPSAFSSGWRNIFVSYTGGYVTIPDSLEQICIELVKYKYEKRDTDSALKSESIGKVYSYTLQDLKNALPPDLMAELELFKSRDF